MNKIKTLVVAVFTISIVSISGMAISLYADQRNYVWTYEYKTMKRGEVELEYYHTLLSPERSKMKGITTTEQQMELEIGMTDKFDFSIYQRYSQKPSQSFKYDGFKLRGRYKLNPNKLFDPLIYAEYKNDPSLSGSEWEFKLILAKDYGKLNISINPIIEIENNETEFEYAAGMHYQLKPLFGIGLEATGSEYANYIGPTITHGNENVWVSFGSGFAIGDVKNNKEKSKLRLLIGIKLK
jgi:hypothetical protein